MYHDEWDEWMKNIKLALWVYFLLILMVKLLLSHTKMYVFSHVKAVKFQLEFERSKSEKSFYFPRKPYWPKIILGHTLHWNPSANFHPHYSFT